MHFYCDKCCGTFLGGRRIHVELAEPTWMAEARPGGAESKFPGAAAEDFTGTQHGHPSTLCLNLESLTRTVVILGVACLNHTTSQNIETLIV